MCMCVCVSDIIPGHSYASVIVRISSYIVIEQELFVLAFSWCHGPLIKAMIIIITNNNTHISPYDIYTHNNNTDNQNNTTDRTWNRKWPNTLHNYAKYTLISCLTRLHTDKRANHTHHNNQAANRHGEWPPLLLIRRSLINRELKLSARSP